MDYRHWTHPPAPSLQGTGVHTAPGSPFPLGRGVGVGVFLLRCWQVAFVRRRNRLAEAHRLEGVGQVAPRLAILLDALYQVPRLVEVGAADGSEVQRLLVGRAVRVQGEPRRLAPVGAAVVSR